MRIAQINIIATLSTGRIAVQLCRMAEEAGHKALMCYSRKHAPADLNSYRIGSSLHLRQKPGKSPSRFKRKRMEWTDAFRCLRNMGLHWLGSKLLDRTGFFSRLPTKRLIRQLEKFKPDIVHLHNIHGYYLYLPRLFQYLKENDIPVVWTLHDCWAFTGHCAYYTEALNAPPSGAVRRRRSKQPTLGCDRWKTGCGHCVLKHAYPSSWILDRSAKNWADKRNLFCGLKHMVLTTPSQWLHDEVKQSFLKNYPVYTLYNGVDLNIFKPCASEEYLEQAIRAYGLEGLGQRRLVLSVAAVWDERKGLNDLIALAEKLGDDYCVAAVGLSKKQLKALPPHTVLGIPRTSNVTDLCALYTAADVYVSASSEETFGMTLVEAMACGTQVLCYNATAMPELVTGDVGEVVPLRNVDALADAVRRLCENPRDPQACIDRAAEFDLDERFGAFMRLYEKMYRFSPAYQAALDRANQPSEDD